MHQSDDCGASQHHPINRTWWMKTKKCELLTFAGFACFPMLLIVEQLSGSTIDKQEQDWIMDGMVP